MHPTGDHVIVLGLVVVTDAGTGEPLAWYDETVPKVGAETADER
jgi:hypothetical protein